jgi:hypothetical protein
MLSDSCRVLEPTVDGWISVTLPVESRRMILQFRLPPLASAMLLAPPGLAPPLSCARGIARHLAHNAMTIRFDDDDVIIGREIVVVSIFGLDGDDLRRKPIEMNARRDRFAHPDRNVQISLRRSQLFAAQSFRDAHLLFGVYSRLVLGQRIVVGSIGPVCLRASCRRCVLNVVKNGPTCDRLPRDPSELPAKPPLSGTGNERGIVWRAQQRKLARLPEIVFALSLRARRHK